MRLVLVLVVLVSLFAGHAARAETSRFEDLWRAGMTRSEQVFSHPAIEPVLAQVLGARMAEFEAATAVPELLERFAGKGLIARGCRRESCAAGGVFMLVDVGRGELLVLLADASWPKGRRVQRFATPGFPFPHESVWSRLQLWQAAYENRR